MENWKDIPESQGRYSVSDLGRIRRNAYRVKTNKGFSEFSEAIIECTLQNGYKRLQFSIHKKKYAILVHRLVACAFIPNPENKPFVNHIDLDKLNNNVCNLEWSTPSENTQHWHHNRPVWNRKIESKASDLISEDGEVFKEWRDSGFLISNFGRVYGKYRSYNTFLTPHIGSGYLRVIFKYNGKRICPNIHRLVAEVFSENPNNYKTVNHIDGDKLNNKSENLEWNSASMNSKHAFSTGLNKGGLRIHSDEKIKEAINLLNSGLSYAKTSKATGISEAHIYRIKHGHMRSSATGVPASDKTQTNKLNEESVRLIKEMVIAGVSKKDVALCFSVSQGAVYKICKGDLWANAAKDCIVPFKPRRQTKLSETDLLRMIEMIKSSASPTDIANEIGCSKSYIYIVKNKYNV